MTVEELIAELKEFDPELDVIIEVKGIKGPVEAIEYEMIVGEHTQYVIINDYKES